MKNLLKFCFTVGLCCLSLLGYDARGSRNNALAAGTQAVSFSPQQLSVSVSDLCTLYVVTESVGDSIGCIECWVSYDTNLVTLVDAQEGDLFIQAPFPRFFLWKTIAPDTQSVEGCLLGFKSYTLSPGKLARYIFQATAQGACPVRITHMRVWDIDRVDFILDLDPDAWIFIDVVTGVEEKAPSHGQLRSYPNPFNPSTTLVLSIPADGRRVELVDVDVAVYAPDGRRIRVLFRGDMSSGERPLFWDGLNDEGARVSSGVYFAVAKTNTETYTTKLVLIE